MKFWEVRFKHTILDDNCEYTCDKEEDPNFFSTLDECMAFIKAQGDLDISQVEITRRYLGTWKARVVLNEP
jgi:hypothetical protein